MVCGVILKFLLKFLVILDHTLKWSSPFFSSQARTRDKTFICPKIDIQWKIGPKSYIPKEI
jgi:hypothetical protein